MIISDKGNILYQDHRLAPNTSYCKRKTLGLKRNGKGINVMQNPSLFPEKQFKARILLEGNLNISSMHESSTFLVFLNISRFILITFYLDHYWNSSEGPEASANGYIRWGQMSQTIGENQAWIWNMSAKFMFQKSQHAKMTVFIFSVLAVCLRLPEEHLLYHSDWEVYILLLELLPLS